MVLLASNLELVKQFATLSELYLADQVDNSDGKDFTENRLEQLLREIGPVLNDVLCMCF